VKANNFYNLLCNFIYLGIRTKKAVLVCRTPREARAVYPTDAKIRRLC